MMRSMTGYARHESTLGNSVLTWEARSVNHRFLELSFRLPEELRAHEADFRACTQQRLGRGKVDLSLRLTQASTSALDLEVDEALVTRLVRAAERICALSGSVQPLRVADYLRWPGVVTELAPATAGLAEAAGLGLEHTLAALIETRAGEGTRLAEALESRCRQIIDHAAAVRARMPALRDLQLARMRERIARLGVEAEPDRLEQELAILAGRMDVDEELDRLEGHVAEVRAILERDEPVGRRLDFVIQELGREANTLGSKSLDTEVSRAAVELKVLIEQMREQAQNVE